MYESITNIVHNKSTSEDLIIKYILKYLNYEIKTENRYIHKEYLTVEYFQKLNKEEINEFISISFNVADGIIDNYSQSIYVTRFKYNIIDKSPKIIKEKNKIIHKLKMLQKHI